MTDWITWHGGSMPVAPGTKIDVRHRDGEEYFDALAGSACCEDWSHGRLTLPEDDGDIVAYRIIADPTDHELAEKLALELIRQGGDHVRASDLESVILDGIFDLVAAVRTIKSQL